jgi:oligopeptide transport system permease protein
VLFIPTLFGALFLLHYLMALGIQINGNPARAVFGDRTPSESELEAMARQFGTDDPCFVHVGNPCLGLFVDRLVGMAQGDFGTDFRQTPVLDLIADVAPGTLRLAFIAFVFDIVVGIAAGVLAGLRGGSYWDYLVKISTVLIVSIPIFVLGYVIQRYVGVNFGNWLRDIGAPDTLQHVFTPSYRDTYPWASSIIPGIVLGAIQLAITARLTRTSLMENLRADYVRTAAAKGLTRSRIVGVHTLRNSLIPVITNLGIDLGVLMSGAVVTEGIFNVNGVGRLVFYAIAAGEAPVVVAVVTIFVLIYLVATLVVDVLYAVLDPRIRYD